MSHKERKINLPSNKREGIIFGLMMVTGMVLVMSFYNFYMSGTLRTLTVFSAFWQLALTFIVAYVIESFIVGPIATKIAFSLPYNKSKRLFVIIALSTCMVIGMVICMSGYGLIMMSISGGIDDSIIHHYGKLLAQNFVVAYPLQLLFVGPISRWILATFIQNGNQQKPKVA